MMMTPCRNILAGAAVVGLMFVGAEAQSPARTGERVGTAVFRQRIGVDANPKASSDYQQAAREESIALMRTTDANHFHYAKVWSEIEPRPGVYNTNEIRSLVQLTSPLPIAFNLRVLDAGARNMPDAYKSLAWDSPEMVGHVADVIGQIAPVLGNRPWSYAIGNEIDLYFASRPGEVPAYGRMLQQVKSRVKTLHPAARFSSCFQFAAAPQLRTVYAPIVAPLDHVTFTYYPLGANFAVRPENSLDADLQTMLAAAQPRPIFLQEIGYPSSALLGSTPDRQSAFVKAAFETIRAAGPTKVFGATYLFQADLPEWMVNLITVAYGNNTPTFRAFVETLGLRDANDRPKPAWDEFVRQAQLSAPQ